MKVAFIGLGSIGTRHLHNIRTLCSEKNIPLEVHAFRSHTCTHVDGVDKQFLLDDQVFTTYDIIFVCNPTSSHKDAILKFQNYTKMMVIEKPIALEPLDEELLNKDVIYYVNCPLRHSAIYRMAKEFIDPSKVISARAICSSYLPAWRKGDYTKNYSAHKEQGGGVEYDLVHEMDYLTDFLGYPKEIHKLAAHISNLAITSNDFATYTAIYDTAYVELHLDYFGRTTKREVEFYTNDDSYVVDFTHNELRSSKASIKADEEDMYMNEMAYILALYNDETNNINDVANANKVLALTLPNF